MATFITFVFEEIPLENKDITEETVTRVRYRYKYRYRYNIYF